MDYIIDHFNEIATGVFMACFAGWIGWRTWRKTRRITAADNFHSSVLSILEGLYPVPSNWSDNIDSFLRSKFPALQSAVTDFRKHLTFSEKTSFDHVWFIYRLGKDGREIDKQYYAQYLDGESATNINGKEIIEINDGKKNFKHNVDALLKFAKKT